MTVPTPQDLVTALQERGRAVYPAGRLRSSEVRTRLVAAARLAGVRVTIARGDDDTFVAVVLDAAQAAEQSRRSTVFRAVNQIRHASELLETELVDPAEFDEDVADLKSIADELEAFVK